MEKGTPEILAPAGSLDIMKRAFQAGADAVYLAGPYFGARAYAVNLTEKELLQGIEYARFHDKKLYLTVNTLLKNEEIDRLYSYLQAPYEAGLPAVIVQDLGVAALIRECFPKLDIHASTQMSVTSVYATDLLRTLGVTRIVPARELSIGEIRSLKEASGLEVEVFVHGALCYSYSGQCLMSSMIGGRSGNRGRCAQPCRQIYRTEHGAEGYLLSLKDLCALRLVPDLIQAGVDSFKIEGRMKQAEYVVATVEAYRRAVESCLDGHGFPVDQTKERLADIYNRGGFTEGYFYQRNGADMMAVERNHHNGIRIGTVERISGHQVWIRLTVNLHIGDVLEIRTKQRMVVELTSASEGTAGALVSVNGRQLRYIRCGDAVFRTKNHQMCRQLLEENDKKRLSENIQIYVRLKKDIPAMIRVSGKGKSVTVKGATVTRADRHPVTREALTEKLNKLGDMPFTLTSVTIELEDDCFYSMKEFNHLRRTAMQEFLRQCTDCHSRRISSAEQFQKAVHDMAQPPASSVQQEMPLLAVSVSTYEQLEVVLDTRQVKRIDLETECFPENELSEAVKRIRQTDRLCYLALPRMFRADMETSLKAWSELSADGYVVRTIDEAGWIHRFLPDAQVVCDQGMYAYNRSAAYAFHEWFPNCHLTLPAELDQRELDALVRSASQAPWEWMIYTSQPVMISAQCLQKTTGNCTHTSGSERISNRHRDGYRVRRICKFCYNVIVEEQPTALFGVRESFQTYPIVVHRIGLTEESAKETRAILNGQPLGACGTGHLKKGIE